MVDPKKQKIFDDCVAEVESKINQYFITVHFSLGMKHYVENNECGCRFVASEKTMKHNSTGKEVFPDLALQDDNNGRGIIGEIKSSVSFGDENVEKIIKQIQSYDHDLVGWDTEDEKISSHDIVSFIHTYDSDQFVNLIGLSDKLELERSYSIAEFSSPQKSPKHGQGDIIIVKHRFGKINCEILQKKLVSNIHIALDDLSSIFDKCKFVRSTPPIQYTMNQLWILIFSTFASRDPTQSELHISFDQIERAASTYFYSWSGIQGETSQIRPRWIKAAMEKFAEIGLAEIVSELPLQYKIFIKKGGRTKNIRKFIIEETCKIEVEGINTLPEGQTTFPLNN